MGRDRRGGDEVWGVLDGMATCNLQPAEGKLAGVLDDERGGREREDMEFRGGGSSH
jgi:hypothetical protein